MSRQGLIRFRGKPVTFTKVTPGAFTSSTGLAGAPTEASVAGYAREIPGDDQEYEQLGLTKRDPRTLEFSPTTPGESPALGATGTWGGNVYTVERVNPVSSTGTPTVSRVVVGR